MRVIHFKSCKVAPSLPLDRIASFLQTQMEFSWKEYIILSGSQLNTILKYDTEGKHVYLFNFGCISFVNFKDSEIYTFISYIETITDKIKHELIYKFSETHTIKVDDDGNCKLWLHNESNYGFHEGIIHIIAIVLAKSIELFKFQTNLESLIDESEKFIILLQKGRLRFFVKKPLATIAKILRFEYQSIHNIRIFDRPVFVEKSLEIRELYDTIAEYYELDDRFKILDGKMDELREIVKRYNNLSHKQMENNLLLFEIFLLLLFPVFHLINFLLDNSHYMNLLIDLLN